jgi:Flp pilus assembly protein TadB
VEPLFTTFLGILMLLVVAAMDAMGMWMILNTVKIDV